MAKTRRKIRSSGRIGSLSRKQARSAVKAVRDGRAPKTSKKQA